MRENAEAKGRRYLAEGRLVVEYVDRGTVRATCRGSDAVYRLGGTGDAWTCDGPARGRCAHLVALGKVVTAESRCRRATRSRPAALTRSRAAAPATRP